MANLGGVVRVLQSERERLTKQLNAISAALSAFGATYSKGAGRPAASATGRGRRSAGAGAPKRRTMSAAARRKIAAAQRARWAKVKAAAKAKSQA